MRLPIGLRLVVFALSILRLLFFFTLRSRVLRGRSVALRLSRLGLRRSLLVNWRGRALFTDRWRRLTRGWLRLLAGWRCLSRWWLRLFTGWRRLTHLRLSLHAGWRCLSRWWLGLLAGGRRLTHLRMSLHRRRRLTRWWLGLFTGWRRLTHLRLSLHRRRRLTRWWLRLFTGLRLSLHAGWRCLSRWWLGLLAGGEITLRTCGRHRFGIWFLVGWLTCTVLGLHCALGERRCRARAHRRSNRTNLLRIYGLNLHTSLCRVLAGHLGTQRL